MTLSRFYSSLVAISAVGLILRLHCLACGSFEMDEGYMALMARASFVELILRAPYEANPPLGPLLYRWWGMLFGRGEYALELVAVVFGSLSIPAIGMLAGRWLDRKAGLAAALLLALSVFHVHFSQFVRAYAAAVFFGLCAAYALLSFLDRPTRWSGAAFVAASFVYLELHYFGIFVFCGLLLYGFSAAPSPAARRGLCWSAAILGVLYLPTAYALALQYMYYRSFEGIPPPSLAYVGALHTEVHARSALLAVLLPNLAAVGAFVWLRRRRRETSYALFLAACLVPFALAVALSLIGASFFLPRYFILAAPAYLVLVAYGIVRLPGRFTAPLLCALIAAGSIGPLRDYYTGRRASVRLKQACSYIAARYRPGDVVLHTLKYSYPQGLYYHDYALEEHYIRDPRTLNLFRVWYEHPAEIELHEAARYRRVWLISPNWVTDEAVDELVERPEFAARGARIDYRSPEHNLFLISLTG